MFERDTQKQRKKKRFHQVCLPHFKLQMHTFMTDR